jgi:hypothetical protein
MDEHEARPDERRIGAEEEPGGYDNPLTRERLSEEGTEKVEVEVGGYGADGTFLGEVSRFAAEEVGSWTDFSMARSQDDRGVTYTLYRLPDGKFRVYELTWSRWQGEGSEAFLAPVVEDEDNTYGPITYDAYTEDEARQAWPHLFAALGMPNTRDTD